jgi:uncharacterized protein (DUF1499 family)
MLFKKKRGHMKRLQLCIGFSIMCALSGCSGHPPASIGVHDGKFSPCPDSPNCVSSMSDMDKSYILPIDIQGDREEAIHLLKRILDEYGGVEVLLDRDGYIHATFRSKVLGFVDDVEFYIPEGSQHIHVRSASRLGYWDVGVNRKRIEKIRALFKS